MYQNEELRCFQVLLYGILEQRGAIVVLFNCFIKKSQKLRWLSG